MQSNQFVLETHPHGAWDIYMFFFSKGTANQRGNVSTPCALQMFMWKCQSTVLCQAETVTQQLWPGYLACLYKSLRMFLISRQIISKGEIICPKSELSRLILNVIDVGPFCTDTGELHVYILFKPHEQSKL